MKTTFKISFLLISLFLFFSSTFVYGFDINIVDNKFNIVDSIDLIELKNNLYFNLKALKKDLKIVYIWEPFSKMLELEGRKNSIKLIINSTKALYNGRLLDLKTPALINESRILVPENILNLFNKSVELIEKGSNKYLIKVSSGDNSSDPITETILKYNKFKVPDIGSKQKSNSNLKTVIIDPGHGGADPGATGPSCREKDITLQIAKKVRDLLKKHLSNVRVLLTRERDRTVDLEDRSLFANKNKGDLFISIHCNAGSKTASGFETFYFSLMENDETDRTVRMLENGAAEKSGAGKIVDFITTDLAQLNYIRESINIAEMVRENLKYKLQIPDRGVKKARFFVLKDTFMPAILIETGFISNRHEENLLKSALFQKKIAVGIVNAIIEYKEKVERK